MIKKVYVPKYIYPLSSVLFNYIIFAISLNRVGSSIYCFEGISNHLSGTGDHSINLITDHSFWSWNDPIYDGSIL